MKIRDVARRLREIAREAALRGYDRREIERRMSLVVEELSQNKTLKRALLDAGLDQAKFLSRSVVSVADRDIAQGLIDRSGSELVRVAESVKTAVAEEVGRVLARGGTVQDVENIVAHRVRGLRSRASAVAVTAQRALNRAVVIQNALRAGITEFEYIGKRGEYTRAWCIKMLEASASGRVWTIDEMRRLDNGQRLDATYYCGGYGCVHTWKPRP